jgi:hypothetical protein
MMVVTLTQLLPFPFCVMLNRGAIQNRAASPVLLSGLRVLALAVFQIVLVALALAFIRSSSVVLALLIVVLKILAPVLAHVVLVLGSPVALIFSILLLAALSPRAPTISTPGVAAIPVTGINGEGTQGLRFAALAADFRGIIGVHRNHLSGVMPPAVISSAGASCCLNYSIGTR